MVRGVQAASEKREAKQRSEAEVVQYAGVVQWQANISFPKLMVPVNIRISSLGRSEPPI